MSDYRSPSSNVLYRLVQAITSIGAVCFLVAGFLGLRALVYSQIGAIPSTMLTGASVAGLIGAPVGLVYLLVGRRWLFRLPIDWISIQLGVVVGGLLYGVYNLIAPFNPQMANIDAGRRFLQGGIDGLFIGAVAGMLVAFINGRRLRLHRAGISRYVVLYLTVLTILWVGILVNRLGGVFNVAWIIVVFALLAAARVVFWNFGAKAHQEEIVEAPAAAPPKKRRASKKKAEPTYIPEEEESEEYQE